MTFAFGIDLQPWFEHIHRAKTTYPAIPAMSRYTQHGTVSSKQVGMQNAEVWRCIQTLITNQSTPTHNTRQWEPDKEQDGGSPGYNIVLGEPKLSTEPARCPLYAKCVCLNQILKPTMKSSPWVHMGEQYKVHLSRARGRDRAGHLNMHGNLKNTIFTFYGCTSQNHASLVVRGGQLITTPTGWTVWFHLNIHGSG